MSAPLLEAVGVSAGYNGRPVVVDCSLSVAEGRMVGVVGRNGAGKTTLVSAMSGRLPTLSGHISLHGKRVEHLPAYRRSRLGITHVPQGREVFAGLSVTENLDLADRGGDRSFVWDLFPRLAERKDQRAGTLSGGEQQMLAIGRAIVAQPRLIVLDEPSLGLAPVVVEKLFESITRLRRETGVTMILVEQQARWMWDSGLLSSVYVLESGRIVAHGDPRTLGEDQVIASYMGRAGI